MPALADLFVVDEYGRRWLSFNWPTKRCGRCRLWLPVEMFGPRRDRPVGLQSRCRQCQVDDLKSRRREGPPLDASYLRGLLEYSPLTGEFRWVVTRSSRARAGQLAGGIDDHGYLQIGIDGWQYRGHRLAFLWMRGEWVPEIDHRDRDRANCRWENLRVSTRSQNQMNAGPRSNNKLGLKGVHKKGCGIQAQIKFNGRQRYLGIWPTAEQAAAAYAKAAIEFHGEFARTG
jgi:hypothetical protein